MKIECINQEVRNPHFAQDLVQLMGISWSGDELQEILDFIRSTTPTTYEKLETLTDRIEFIQHLRLVADEAGRQDYQFSGREIEGINYDIDALRMYLALTCVDILATNFEPFDDWIINNCADFQVGEDLSKYLDRKSGEYRALFQLSSNFVKAFTSASATLKAALSGGLTVTCSGGKTSAIERIAAYLYRVRNKYTHEGRRFFAAPILFDRLQGIGPRDKEYLNVKTGFDLIDAVLSVAKEQANRTLKKFAEQRAARRTGSSSASASR